MTIIKYLIIVTIVPFIVDIFNYKNEPKNYTKSIEKFTIRTGKSIITIGIGWFIFTTVLMALCLYQNEKIPELAIAIFVIFYFFSLISFLYATPRFWDIVVDGDNITIIKLFIFTKRVQFSNIVMVEIGQNNYIKVYKEGKKRAFFLIDPMMKGKNNFLKRAEKEGISIINRRCVDKDSTEK